METQPCPGCKAVISGGVKRCPLCGADVRSPWQRFNEDGGKVMTVVVAIVLSLPFAFALFTWGSVAPCGILKKEVRREMARRLESAGHDGFAMLGAGFAATMIEQRVEAMTTGECVQGLANVWSGSFDGALSLERHATVEPDPHAIEPDPYPAELDPPPAPIVPLELELAGPKRAKYGGDSCVVPLEVKSAPGGLRSTKFYALDVGGRVIDSAAYFGQPLYRGRFMEASFNDTPCSAIESVRWDGPGPRKMHEPPIEPPALDLVEAGPLRPKYGGDSCEVAFQVITVPPGTRVLHFFALNDARRVISSGSRAGRELMSGDTVEATFRDTKCQDISLTVWQR